MRMQTVTIIGTGLIGGSLALALKRAFPSLHVAGVDKPEVVERARRLNIIDSVEPRPSELIVLETTLVTDVGSTKAAICNKAERIGVPFVGGHPMAGLEQSGPDAANAELFKDAPYFLCRTKSSPDGAIERMCELAEAVGAIPQVISAENHDRLVAQISHLPQIISTALADQTAGHAGLAGPGLRSMTRLAASPFHVWRDIFKTSGFLPEELQTFIERLQRILDLLEAGQFDELETLFKTRSAP
jgi:prephenate dehydrogenase